MSDHFLKKTGLPCIIVTNNGYFHFNIDHFDKLNQSIVSISLNSPSIYPFMTKNQLRKQRHKLMNEHCVLQFIPKNANKTQNVQSHILKKQ